MENKVIFEGEVKWFDIKDKSSKLLVQNVRGKFKTQIFWTIFEKFDGRKGDKVRIEGRIGNSKRTQADGTDKWELGFFADKFEVVGWGAGEKQEPLMPDPPKLDLPSKIGPADFEDDDIPF